MSKETKVNLNIEELQGFLRQTMPIYKVQIKYLLL